MDRQLGFIPHIDMLKMSYPFIDLNPFMESYQFPTKHIESSQSISTPIIFLRHVFWGVVQGDRYASVALHE